MGRLDKGVFFAGAKFIYYLLPILVSCLAVVYFGKDVNSDALNYHAYAAFALLEGRIEVDFFPAGPQSYLNPVAYLPFYFLRDFLSDFWMAITFAVLNSAAIYAVVLITNEFIRKSDDIYTYYLGIACSLLTTVFWQTVGSSFIDGYICALILFGFLYFIRSFTLYADGAQNKNLIFSAFFFGVASGLKLTAILYCAAAGVVLFLLLLSNPKKWIRLTVFFLCGVVGFLLIEGWWAYMVYERTGNPFFPYFNNIFESPFYVPQSITNDRFTPESWVDVLLFPVYAVMPSPWLYQELRAPDIRFAVFFFLLFFCVLFRWVKITENTAARAAIFFFILSYFLWLITTGNGRYGIHLFLLPGVFIAWFSLLLFGRKIAKSVVLIVVIVQCICLWVGAAGRYSEQEFSGEWFEYDVPDELSKTPALFISLDVNSLSFLVERLHESSIFTNLSGQLLLPKGKKLDSFLKDSTEKVSGNIWFVSKAAQDALPIRLDDAVSGSISAELMPKYLYVINTRLSRLAMSVDTSRCLYVSPGKGADFMISPLIVACKVKADELAFENYKRESVQYDLVFDKIEKTCPKLFNPSTSFTENMGDLWGRKYLGSETRMYVSTGSVWVDFSDRVLPLHLGTFSELQQASAIINCDNSIPRMSRDAW